MGARYQRETPAAGGEECSLEMLLGNAPIWSRGSEKTRALLLFPPTSSSPSCWCPAGSLGVLGFHLCFPQPSPRGFSSLLVAAVTEQGPEGESKRPIPAGFARSGVAIFLKNKTQVITNLRFSDLTPGLFLGWALHRGFCFGFLSRGRN